MLVWWTLRKAIYFAFLGKNCTPAWKRNTNAVGGVADKYHLWTFLHFQVFKGDSQTKQNYKICCWVLGVLCPRSIWFDQPFLLLPLLRLSSITGSYSLSSFKVSHFLFFSVYFSIFNLLTLVFLLPLLCHQSITRLLHSVTIFPITFTAVCITELEDWRCEQCNASLHSFFVTYVLD